MENDLAQKTEFLWRRLLEAPPGWVVLLPVAFALLVVFLLWLFRRDRGFRGVAAPLVVVLVLSAIYLALAPILLPFASWFVVLVPMVAVALVYVVLMYLQDARTIHPAWASFLGLLRCTVYGLLAVVFLLPGCQNYEAREYHSKVLMLFDVSGSMFTVDDLPEIGQDPATLPSRQSKVHHLLTANVNRTKQPQTPLLDRMLSRTPLTLYRFGSVLDENHFLHLKEARAWDREKLAAWMRPDKQAIDPDPEKSEAEQQKERLRLENLYDSLLTGTNLGGAALQLAKLESGSFLQAVVIVSDGQSNLGSDEALREFLTRVQGGKRQVPVITVGVGEYRQPANIRVEDMQAPEIARPDDKFPIRVPVVGTGLVDEEFSLTLEVRRVKDALGQPTVGEQKYALGPLKGKFKGAGDHPQDTIEFEIDVQELKSIKSKEDKNGDLEGTWEFVAKVPRHPREAYPKAEHVSDPPTQVLVQKKPLRVLLFSSGPSRDYQFLRTILYRESLEKRVELSVLLQSGQADHVEQDVEKERMLTTFPDRLAEDPANKHMSLSEYDLVIAFDPDWTQLDENQAKLLKEWVGNQAGGVVFVAGPVHTFNVARPAGLDQLLHIQTLFPVVLSDSRLPTLSLNHDPTRPYALNFTGAAKLFDFLKLDEDGESPIAGWNEFFWRNESGPPEGEQDPQPVRGFHNFYPVERVRPDSTVIATFAGPPSTRINNGADEMPYLVSMRYGSGKTMFIGSSETWRLRQKSSDYHERFWIKLARWASAGVTPQKRYGRILLARTVSAGTIPVEAQLKGKDLLPLPRDARPTLQVQKVGSEAKAETFDLKAKTTQGDWTGWFASSVTIREPGEYEFRIPVPGTGETLAQRLTVRKPNPELDNVRTNFGLLHQVATEAGPLLAKLPADTRRDAQRLLQTPTAAKSASETREEGPRLFLPLSQADELDKLLVQVAPKREEVKGKLEDLWDDGVSSGYTVDAYYFAMGVPAALGLLGFAILMFLRQTAGAVLFLGGFLAISLGVFLATAAMDLEWAQLPVDFSYVLVAIVSLLALEWLTRKLLKLA